MIGCSIGVARTFLVTIMFVTIRLNGHRTIHTSGVCLEVSIIVTEVVISLFLAVKMF